MRIAGFVLIALLLLSSVSLAFAVQALWSAHQLVVRDVVLAELAESKSDWYQGTVALSLERSVTQVALARDDRITSDFRDLIAQQRAESDGLLLGALEGLDNLAGFENYDRFVAAEGRARERIAELRAEADRLLQLPLAQRDPVRTKQMPYELKAEIESMFAAANLLLVPDGETSAEEMMLSRIQTLAWEIREYGGRARTFYAIATLRGEPIPEALAGEARIDTGRAIAGWRQLQTVVSARELPPEFLAQVDAAEAPFVGTYLRALTELDTAMERMRAGEVVELPYTFAEFFALSNTGLDAVANLAPVSGQFIQDYWAKELASARLARWISIAAALAIVALTYISLAGLQKKLVRPLTAATGVLRQMAEGNLDREFRQTKRGLDEIWVIWQAMEKLTYTLREARDKAAQEKEAEKRAKDGIIGALLQGLKKMSAGDFTQDVPNTYGRAYEELVENYNSTVQNLRDLVSDVKHNAADIEAQSSSMRDAVGDLSQRTEEQSVSVAQTVELLGEFSNSIGNMVEQANQSSTLVVDAAEKASNSAEVVKDAITAMDRIKASTEEVNSFTGVINEIAFQTNLLALNASVEASRAGDAGKGFAVVANEIRALAQRAAEAARDITGVIEQSVMQVDVGVQQVTQTGETLREINEMVMDIQSVFTEITTASNTQKAGVSEIGATMDQLGQMTQQNAQMAEQTNDTSGQLQESSMALRTVVDRFVIDQQPSADMRAA